jgi:hypothetical protein
MDGKKIGDGGGGATGGMTGLPSGDEFAAELEAVGVIAAGARVEVEEDGGVDAAGLILSRAMVVAAVLFGNKISYKKVQKKGHILPGKTEWIFWSTSARVTRASSASMPAWALEKTAWMIASIFGPTGHFWLVIKVRRP